VQIENKEMATISKALIIYAQYLERKNKRLEEQVIGMKVKKEPKSRSRMTDAI
jgi:hypothetical protein